MIPDLLRHPEPALLADSATPDEVLQALRACTAEDGWPADALDLLDFLFTSWTADLAGRPDDREGLAELQRLIDYALTRARNHPSLPAPTAARWSGFKDVLEARRCSIAGRDPGLILDRRHVRDILNAIATDCDSQLKLTDKLRSAGIAITPGRMSQLLSLMEAHGLITRKREGRENRLFLTDTGRAAAPLAPPTLQADRPLKLKLAA